MKKEKDRICTAKQRKVFIEWLSDNAEELAGLFNENAERSDKSAELNEEMIKNFTKQIDLREKTFIELLMAEKFDKKEAVDLIQNLLELSRNICECYKKESSTTRKQLYALYEKVLLSLFFVSRDGFDLDEMRKELDALAKE